LAHATLLLRPEGYGLGAMKNQLDFEKPIAELQATLEELKSPGSSLPQYQLRTKKSPDRKKIEETRRGNFLKLSAWNRNQNSTPSKRPFTLNLPGNRITDFTELHGDRVFAEDFGPWWVVLPRWNAQGHGDRHAERPRTKENTRTSGPRTRRDRKGGRNGSEIFLYDHHPD